MASTRQKFKDEVARVTADDSGKFDPVDDATTREALRAFARALDPDRERPRLRKPGANGTLKDVEVSHNTATDYLRTTRLTYTRGFDLLGGTAEAYNDFMLDMVDGTLKNWNGSIKRSTAGQYQAGARAFYRFLDEPGKSDERPDAAIGWPADDIHLFTDESEPRYDESDMFTDAEVDALREGCIKTRNSRRDRTLIELMAGTVQRIEAIRTLLVKHVHVDPGEDVPYVLLNPAIRGNGDKGAIDNSGRWKPIVSNAAPIREYLANHPLRDADIRAAHGCPDRFEECYLLVGNPSHPDTDASQPWNETAIRDMLTRLGNRVGVDKPVKPHNFRHWGYSKSKELPIDEGTRRTVFGWSPGSNVGETTYGHVGAEQAGRQYAEEWATAFGGTDEAVPSSAEQLIGQIAGGDLPPEARKAIVNAIMADADAKQELIDGVEAALR